MEKKEIKGVIQKGEILNILSDLEGIELQELIEDLEDKRKPKYK